MPKPADPADPAATGRRLPLTVGPAFVAAVAYLDPGNFATDFSAGARHGFLLIWVVVAANLTAMPVQYLSAELGPATLHMLPQLCRVTLRPAVNLLLWVVAELVTTATELAEILGTALALNLLLGLDPLPAGLIGRAASALVLTLTGHGRRPFEAVVGAMLLVIVAAFAYQALAASPLPYSTADPGRGSHPARRGLAGPRAAWDRRPPGR